MARKVRSDVMDSGQNRLRWDRRRRLRAQAADSCSRMNGEADAKSGLAQQRSWRPAAEGIHGGRRLGFRARAERQQRANGRERMCSGLGRERSSKVSSWRLHPVARR
jgi:hypothetical protein